MDEPEQRDPPSSTQPPTTIGPPGAPVDPYPSSSLPGEQYLGVAHPAELYPYPSPPHPTTPYPTVPMPPPTYPSSPAYGQQLLQPATVTVVVAPPSSGAAIASMILGIIGIVFVCFSCGIPSLLAIIFGHVGLNQTRNNAMTGRGFAVAGTIMGYALIIPALIATAYLFSYYEHIGVHAGPPPSPPRY